MDTSKMRFPESETADPTGEGRPQILRGHQPEEIRRWVKALCNLADISPTRLARSAGLAATTINRFLNKQSFKYSLSANTIDALYRAAIREKVRNDGEENVGVKKGSFSEIIDYKIDTIQNMSLGIKSIEKLSPIPVIGIISELGELGENTKNFEPYVISLPLLKDEKDYIGIILENRSFARYAYEVIDCALDLIYPKGTILICEVSVESFGIPLEYSEGSVFILRYNNTDGSFRRIPRILRYTNSSLSWFWTKSDNPEQQTPIPYFHLDTNDYVIEAIVEGIYRPELPKPR